MSALFAACLGVFPTKRDLVVLLSMFTFSAEPESRLSATKILKILFSGSQRGLGGSVSPFKLPSLRLDCAGLPDYDAVIKVSCSSFGFFPTSSLMMSHTPLLLLALSRPGGAARAMQ